VTVMITPRDLPKWVPGELLGSSESQGWSGVTLRSYRYRGQDVEVPPLNEFVIVAYQRGQTPMQRRFQGAWTRTRCTPGDFSLLTRAQASHWCWTDDIDVAHVYLSDKFVSAIAVEITGRNAAEVRLHDILQTRDPLVTGAVHSIAAEAATHSPGGSLYVEAVATQLVVHLLRRYASVSAATPSPRGTLSPAQCRQLSDYIDAHLGEPLTLQRLAAATGLGVWSFSRRFRVSFGRAPHAYVVERRIDQARRLLGHGALPVKEIASLCGFSDQAHMTRAFRQHLKVTPAVLRRNGPD
jgi:AraC family transcriptional regulator